MSTKFHPSRKALIGVTQPRDNLGVPWTLDLGDFGLILYQVSFFTGKNVDLATGVADRDQFTTVRSTRSAASY